MDEISLTDLRRQFFGPTLDESILYGVDCLMDLFGVDRDKYQPERQTQQEVVERMSLKRSASDLNAFEPFRDASVKSEEKTAVSTLDGDEERKSSDASKRDSVDNSINSNDTPKENVSSTSSTSMEEKLSKGSSLKEKLSAGKKRSINLSLSSKEPSKSPRNSKLSSSSEHSRKTKSSSTGSSKSISPNP